MKLQDAREHYYFFSGKTSEIIRQLGFAGIAVIWIFKHEVQGTPKIPEALLLPLGLIIFGLACDLLHYAIATSIWGIYQRNKEKSGTDEHTSFKAPRQFNWPAIVFFILKVISIVVAYIYILLYVSDTILVPIPSA